MPEYNYINECSNKTKFMQSHQNIKNQAIHTFTN